MALLKIYKHGELLQSVDLFEDNQYIAGRSEKCDIVLDDGTGVSRQHFRLSFDGQNWSVELLSKFGGLTFLGAEVSTVQLESNQSFIVHPYEFVFEDHSQGQNKPALVPNNEDGFEDSVTPAHPAMSADGNMDHTMVGRSKEIPYLRLTRSDSNKEDILRLEGNLWTAGRESDCEIQLLEKGVSRHHFEITQTNEGFYITDLNSSNGTTLNGEKIETNRPTKLNSGDIISILDLTLYFEIRDPEFDKRVDLVPTKMLAPIEEALPAASGDMAAAHPSVLKTSGEDWEDLPVSGFKENLKKHRIKIATIAILLLALVFSSDPPAEKRGPASTGQEDAFSKLTKDQQVLVKDTYSLAKNLYLQQKYELALTELQRIHELVPFYDDSKQLEGDCRQFLDIRKQQEYINAQKERAQALRLKVDALVADCEEGMSATTTLDELNECLSQPREMMPDHPGIQPLLDIVEEREANQRIQREQRNRYQARVRRGEGLYNKALKLENGGQDYKAINAYKDYLKTKLPDPKNLRPKAQRSVASLESAIDSKVQQYLEQAKSFFEQSDMQRAIDTIREGLKVNPKSRELKENLSDFKRKHSQQMKVIYSDSVLEESVGNIESAKDKWRKILELSYKGESYYKKAKSKLKKYGNL